MLSTVEVRWFVGGALPEAVEAWFEDVAGRQAAEERTDRYVGTAAEDLGVKVRQGLLEVKQRTAVIGPERWGGVAGHVETWRKWSLELAADARPADWVGVEKKRWMVPFRMKEGRVVQATQVGARANGVNVELSAVKVGGRPWWSVCLESFGPGEAARRGVLRAVAAHVFRGQAPPGLTAEASKGYPAWLREAAP